MSDFKKYQDKVKDLLGPEFNFQNDRDHAGKDSHVDLTRILSGGSAKAEVDFNGNVCTGSSTQFSCNGKSIKLDFNGNLIKK